MSRTEIDINEVNTKHGTDYTQVWNALQSEVFLVVTEEGDNTSNGQIRHLLGRYWLYCDDDGGYEVFHEDTVEDLILVTR